MVTGSVNSTSKGLIKILSSTSTRATITAVKKLSTEIPGIKYDSNTTNTAVKKIFMSVFISNGFKQK